MAESVLVTGGAGFIGGHLVDAALAAGHRVRILDSLDPQVHGARAKPPAWLSGDVDVRIGSVLDRAAVGEALDGIDVVFHQAALVGVGQSMYQITQYCEANTLGSAILAEEIVRRRDRVRKVVVASSMSAYGEGAHAGGGGRPRPGIRRAASLAAGDWAVYDAETGEPLEAVATPETKPLEPSSVYAVTKRDQEELFLTVGRSYGVPTVALRYFNAYGSRQALSNPYTGVAAIFACRLLAGRPPIVYEDGRQRRDFVHVSDLVAANLAALASSDADYQAVNVGSGQPVTVLEVAQGVASHLHRDELAPEVTSTFRTGDIRHCWADISRARRLLGYQPKVAFGQGLAELVEWASEQSPEDRFDLARAEMARHGLTR